jgi:hypothetical protein
MRAARSRAARNITSVVGRHLRRSNVRCAHHSPNEARAAVSPTLRLFSIVAKVASKSYMLRKIHDIPVLCSMSTRARGQPSRTLLNREFPHQVLVLADNVRGRALDSVNAFHDVAGVPIKSRSARKDDKWYCLLRRATACAVFSIEVRR